MNIEENQQDNIDTGSSQDLASAEASLEDALSAIKQGTEGEPKREILRLPKKEEIKEEAEEPDISSDEDEQFDPKEFVEIESPQIQKKINYLYKQVKSGGEVNAMLRHELQKLTGALEQKDVNEKTLAKKLFEIENRFNKQDEDSILSNLRNQYKAALEEGNYDDVQKINEKILDFKTEQKLNAVIANQKVAEEQAKPKTQQFYSDPQDVSDANSLTSEKSEDGSLLRPWLQANHPQFQDVVDVVAAMSNKYIRKGQRPSLSSIMQEVDKMMGVNKKGTSKETTLKHPAVLSSNTTIGAQSENQESKLSNLERSYANKLGIDEKSYAKIKKYGSGPITVEKF
jgi:hypothetical protein